MCYYLPGETARAVSSELSSSAACLQSLKAEISSCYLSAVKLSLRLPLEEQLAKQGRQWVAERVSGHWRKLKEQERLLSSTDPWQHSSEVKHKDLGNSEQNTAGCRENTNLTLC